MIEKVFRFFFSTFGCFFKIKKKLRYTEMSNLLEKNIKYTKIYKIYSDTL